MKLILILSTTFSLITISLAQTIDSQSSIANSDNVFSILTNPAGLGTDRGFQLLYATQYNEIDFQNIHTFAFNLGYLGFAYQENKEGGIDFSRYSLGTGWKSGKMMKMGVSYSWNTNGNLADGLSLGYLFRPHKMISFGLNGNFLNEPKSKKPDYQAGISFRPFSNRFTLSADAYFTNDNGSDYFDDTEWRVQIETEPVDGILLKGTYSDDYFGLGLGLAFKYGVFGSFNSFDSKDKFENGNAFIQTSSQNFRSFAATPKPKTVHFVLRGSVIEQNRGWGLFASTKLTVYQFAKIIEKLIDDKTVSGIVLEIDGFSAGYAKIQEMTNFLREFKETGKELYVYAEKLNTRQYLLAAEADKIFMHPAGHLNLTGIQFISMFIKGTLDKLGIVAELEGGYDRFISRVAEGREMTKEEVNEIGRGRVWTGKQGLEKGIVDKLGGLFDAIEAAEKRAGIEEDEDYGVLMLPKYGFVWPIGGSDFVMDSNIYTQLPEELQQLIQYGYKFKSFENEPYLYMMPYDLIIE